MATVLTPAKAKKILRDGEVRGTPLTQKQKDFFGAVAGGEKPRGGSHTQEHRDRIAARVAAESERTGEDLTKRPAPKPFGRERISIPGIRVIKVAPDVKTRLEIFKEKRRKARRKDK